MQVVYSGGSTPTPSPRVKRKEFQGYGRPFLPGYSNCSITPPIHQRSKDRTSKESSDTDSSLRDTIPAMRRPVAITCLVLNILIPGLGTFVAGLTVFCGSVIRFKDSGKYKVICSNTWVAFLQFLTAFLFLLGWIWSIVWGVAFITISNDYFKHFKRPHMPLKVRGHSQTSRDQLSCSSSKSINRTGSSPLIASSSHHAMLRSSSADHPTQPVIVLQKTPLLSHSESSLVNKSINSEDKSMHRKLLRRQMSDKEQAAREMTQDRLEHIVIHNLPRAPVRRGVLRRDDTVTSTTSTVSEEEITY